MVLTIDNDTLITSAGIIRNRSKPRTGIISANSLDSSIYDLIDEGINITFEEYIDDKRNEYISEGLTEEEIEEKLENDGMNYENDYHVNLIGDWIKDSEGKYIPDTTKEFSAVFNSDSNNISVKWSKYTKHCNNTSLCYVMANGDGPCGNLDSQGDNVLAYDLPKILYRNDNE